MESLFVAGTDTDVGKTFVAAGLAAVLRRSGADVGVMKPYAAGPARGRGYRSDDARLLSEAAGAADPDELVNPEFFPVAASPYTAWKSLGTRPRVRPVLSALRRLSAIHDIVLVEGIGGVMTPILGDYFLADLVRDSGLPALLVTRNRIGAISHAVMTAGECARRRIPVRGIVISVLDPGGYDPGVLARDLEALTGAPVLGAVPRTRSRLPVHRALDRDAGLRGALEGIAARLQDSGAGRAGGRGAGTRGRRGDTVRPRGPA